MRPHRVAGAESLDPHRGEPGAGRGRAAPHGEELPLTVMVPPTGWHFPDVRELWGYQELLYFLVWRDIKVRYKQTALGAAWAILQPVLTMVVFSVFFGRLAGVPSDELPYPLFAFSALVPWTFFATGLASSADSLVGSQALLKRVYFPRLAIPTAAVVSGVVDFALAFGVLLVLMVFYGFLPDARVLWIFPLLGLALMTSLGVGLWLSALNVQYRDVRHTVPFITQFWLLATPIAYPSSLLEEPWRTLYGLNPMVGVVEGFRWALLGTDTAPGLMLLVSAVVSLLILVGGALYFQRMERSFADVV
jgi:lipopolysaccharide transport system permease protein